MMPSNHLILYHPLLLLPSIFPSNRVFFNESVLCIRWPKDWSFSFSISPSNEYSGLISCGWTGWISLLSKGLSRVPATQFKSKFSCRNLTPIPFIIHQSMCSVCSQPARHETWAATAWTENGNKSLDRVGGFQAPISLRKGQSPTLLPSLGTFSSPSPSA